MIAPGRHGSGAILRGHFARFGEWAHIKSAREGEFYERIAPGAFSETITRNRGQMKCLLEHGKDPSVGQKPLGEIIDLREDEHGAAYAVRLFDAQYVRELLPALRSGQYGASFRFSVTRQRLEKMPRRSSWNPDGLPERTITGAHVREFGPVLWGAYKGATAKVDQPKAAAAPRSRHLPRRSPTRATWVIPPTR